MVIKLIKLEKKKFQKFYIHFILTFTGNHVRKESSAGAKWREIGVSVDKKI